MLLVVDAADENDDDGAGASPTPACLSLIGREELALVALFMASARLVLLVEAVGR